VELLGDVGLDWIDAQGRRRDAREGEEVVGDDGVGLPEDRIAEGSTACLKAAGVA